MIAVTVPAWWRDEPASVASSRRHSGRGGRAAQDAACRVAQSLQAPADLEEGKALAPDP
jgi:hypothetical protein